MLSSPHPSPLRRARTWVSRSLFQSPEPGLYFEYLLEGLFPTRSFVEPKARVVRVVRETHDTASWVLRPSGRFRGFVAGQHVQLVVQVNGSRRTRTFSLSSAPSRWRADGTITVTVKRVPDGRVTGWMHEHLSPGDVVALSHADGAFTLEGRETGNLAYLAAGSGITPVMSQLRQLAEEGMPRRAALVYFANAREDFIFGEEIAELERRFAGFRAHLVASRQPLPRGVGEGAATLPQRTIGPEHVRALLESEPAHLFACGPPGFRRAARALLDAEGFDLGRLVEESFGPERLGEGGGPEVEVAFRASGRSATSSGTSSLLEVAERAGLSPRHGCRMGICHTCKCTKRSGRVRNLVTGEVSGPGHEDIQICVSTPVTDVDLEL